MKRDNAILGLISFILVLFIPFKGYCTPEYASQTGKTCEACHVDPTGGGKLTEEGKTFRDDLKVRGLYRPLKPVQRMVRFILGYIHLLTAIIWFGTILYVHLLLKPAYASKGLPRGELFLGWFSIPIMALTGTLLTIARVPSWHMLFHTRFGVLLLIKISLFLVMVAMASFVTFLIGPKLRKRKQLNIEKKNKTSVRRSSHLSTAWKGGPHTSPIKERSTMSPEVNFGKLEITWESTEQVLT